MTRKMDTLREDRYTLMVISCSVLLRIRNISDKSCRDSKNPFYVL